MKKDICVDKETNVVVCISKKIIAKTINGNECFFPTENECFGYNAIMFPVVKDVEIGESVKSNEYCYTKEKGFYPNPNWSEPNKYGVADETVAEIIADNTKLLESIGVLGGAK
ncbi:MAG: hypothetical protein RSN61_21400 [Chryseobacterium sp.]|uniref:hypothetical protein n=1 Tax=Chryseobacterium sp. TaxID=1871047 RepID=UPI002FCC250E